MTTNIPFSPPDISDLEIQAVVEVLKSGWITTGPKTKLFEKKLAEYCGARKSVCLNSATAGMELVLRLLEIGPGDEVITTPYTYAATANVILHTGAKPVFVDLKKNSFDMDPVAIKKAINSKTKLIMPVDFAGISCHYDEIFEAINSCKKHYAPSQGTLQEKFERIPILCDAAHSFGASFGRKKTGCIADFSVFSFHAVKNLTTGEGGAILFNDIGDVKAEEIYRRFMLLALHGQNKDALAKTGPGGWKYDIELPGFKFNMTDIAAAIGLMQLERYDSEILPRREAIVRRYDEGFGKFSRSILPLHFDEVRTSSFHLYPLRIKEINEEERANIIIQLAHKGVSANVHFIPVVMHSAYTSRGYDINHYPNCYDMYRNEISLPLYPALQDENVERVIQSLSEFLQ